MTTVPAVPEGKYASIGDDLRIHYHEQGTGPAVVYVHGSGPGASGWSNFKGNYPFLAERGYRTLVPDTLGYGYSSKPTDRDYELSMLADCHVRFLDSVGVQKATLVGNSHGGALSIQIALTHPDRVEKLILMAPGGLEEREVYMQMRGIRSMIKAQMDPGGITEESMRRVFSKQLFDPALVTDEIIQERLQVAELIPKKVLGTMKVPHLAPRLSELSCSVLGLWGMDDQFCPVSGATTLAREIRGSRVVLFNSCGHWVMVEHRDTFNRLCLDFLENG